MFTKPLKWIKLEETTGHPSLCGRSRCTHRYLDSIFFVFRLIPEWNWYGSNRCLSSAYIISGNASFSPLALVTRPPRFARIVHRIVAQVVLPSPRGNYMLDLYITSS